MSQLDGTGPMGKGPMTGGGFGRCITPVQDGPSIDQRTGRGFGCRRGRGMRQRFCRNSALYVPTPPRGETAAPDSETKLFQSRIESLENSLHEIKKQLEEANQPKEHPENS